MDFEVISGQITVHRMPAMLSGIWRSPMIPDRSILGLGITWEMCSWYILPASAGLSTYLTVIVNINGPFRRICLISEQFRLGKNCRTSTSLNFHGHKRESDTSIRCKPKKIFNFTDLSSMDSLRVRITMKFVTVLVCRISGRRLLIVMVVDFGQYGQSDMSCN